MSTDSRPGSEFSAAPLPRSFYEPSAKVVAPRLLGHFLLRRTPEGMWAGGEIVECEAYLNDDPACHGFRGETQRNRSMFGAPGHAYVYFIYGNYFCFNAVCSGRGTAEAVLIRAIEPTINVDWMCRNRPVPSLHGLTSGPAKLCLALQIDRRLDGADITVGSSSVIVAANPERNTFLRRRGPRAVAPRIGLSIGQEALLRFLLAGSQCVSRRAQPAA